MKVYVIFFAAICVLGACSSDATIEGADAAADTVGKDGGDGSAGDGSEVGTDPSKIWCTPEQRVSGFCDDADKCTQNDRCQVAGFCLGSSIQCNDDNVCTDDMCTDPKSGCDFSKVKVAAACNDNNACTDADQCNSTGTCVGQKPVTCNDNNTCTTDTCDQKKGCTYTFKPDAPCEDGDYCTKPDTCVDGVCKVGAKVKCDDNNPCTFDQCEPNDGSCVYQPLGDGQPCTDNDGCTQSDFCKQAICVSGPKKNCDDNDSCTTEKCNGASGQCEVFFTGSIVTPCTDSNACTEFDTCEKLISKCQGVPKSCQDGNECTQDICDTVTGCINKPDDGKACSDGSKCTQEDKCKQSKCQGIALACNDNNACTIDFCSPEKGECTYSPNVSQQCDDKNNCTKDDLCSSAGVCTGTNSACTDSNVCTSDTCDPVAGCKYSNLNGLPCTDTNPCTTGDFCQEGTCKFKVDLCDDGNSCTTDKCLSSNGTCANTALEPNKYSCKDPGPCSMPGVCIVGGVCAMPPKCEDKNPCTLDLCDPNTGACKFVPISDCKP